MRAYRLTMNRYLAGLYAGHILGLLAILISIMSVFEAVELGRRVAKAGDAGFSLVLGLTLLKLPGNVLMIAPFVVLFAAIFMLTVLNRRQELTILRTGGASLWQLMFPLFFVAFVFGVVLVGLVNPISAVTARHYQRYEEQFLKNESHVLALVGQGLWLRQGKQDKDAGYAILHAEKVTLPAWDLEGVMVLSFSSDHGFQERLDAPRAVLGDAVWHFPTAVQTRPGHPPEAVTAVDMPTTLTRTDLAESFATPETVSVWQMPGFIRLLRAGGFPTGGAQVRFGALLVLPFLCMALIMVAAAVSIRPARAGGQLRLIVFGVALGFGIFFISHFLQALGASGQIPIWLAATGPAILTGAGGIMAIFGMEDQ